MRVAVFNEPRSIMVAERPDPVIKEPTDAIVRVVLACVCGSNLWFYRGESPFEPGPIGHEFIGVVEDVGSEVSHVAKGDFVICPFAFSDGTCPHCRHGITSACVAGGFYPSNGDGGHGEAMRVPLADGTLVKVGGSGHSNETLRSLLTLSDVLATGHHAAVCASVEPGSTVAVVGDGAVGLCGVLAASRLGAERVIVLSRNPDRQRLATRVRSHRHRRRARRGGNQEGDGPDRPGRGRRRARVRRNGAGDGHCFRDRQGGRDGRLRRGAPRRQAPLDDMFHRNVGMRGGSAPARAYIPELLVEVLEGRINPGRVFDFDTDLDGIAEAYAAMDERRAIKSLLSVGSI